MPASKKLTLRRLVVYLSAALILVLASPTPSLFWVGAALASSGVVLRIWACGHLRKNQAVIQSGPYAHVKNPLYLGTFLITMGLVLGASNPANISRYLLILFLPFFLGVFFVYYLPHKFAVEGDRLRRRFGEEWDRYDSAVPDFVPRITPFARSEVRWEPSLVVHNSEVGMALVVVLGMALLAVRMQVAIPGLW